MTANIVARAPVDQFVACHTRPDERHRVDREQPGDLLSQRLMNKRDRDGSFADRRGDTLDVAAADVANCKDAGPVGFE